MDNPDLVGVYIGYEPNAFDGKDAEFVNFDEAHDGCSSRRTNRIHEGTCQIRTGACFHGRESADCYSALI